MKNVLFPGTARLPKRQRFESRQRDGRRLRQCCWHTSRKTSIHHAGCVRQTEKTLCPTFTLKKHASRFFEIFSDCYLLCLFCCLCLNYWFYVLYYSFYSFSCFVGFAFYYVCSVFLHCFVYCLSSCM